MGIFSKRVKLPAEQLPMLQPEDPVNYNSVLDWLVGLSKTDYIKMTKSVDIYRDANAKVAKVIGVRDEPNTTIKQDKPTEEEEDTILDAMLNASSEELLAALEEPFPPAHKKAQAPSNDKKIKVL